MQVVRPSRGTVIGFVALAIPASAGAGACSAFGAGVESPADAGPTLDNEAGSDANEADATALPPPASVVDGGGADIDGGTLSQPAIGTGCANRKPPWLVCLDFEDGTVPPNAKKSSGDVMVTQTAPKVLRTSVNSGTIGVANVQIPIPDKAKRVVWSFDVLIDAAMADETGFGTLLLPGVGNDVCSVQIDRSAGKIRFVEYCKIGGETTEPVIAALSLPLPPNGWFNVYVDASFTNNKVTAYLIGPQDFHAQGSGTVTKLAVGPKAVVQLGIASATSSSTGTNVDVDNAVIWWEK